MAWVLNRPLCNKVMCEVEAMPGHEENYFPGCPWAKMEPLYASLIAFLSGLALSANKKIQECYLPNRQVMKKILLSDSGIH